MIHSRSSTLGAFSVKSGITDFGIFKRRGNLTWGYWAPRPDDLHGTAPRLAAAALLSLIWPEATNICYYKKHTLIILMI
eukprot:4631-Hanusia_phi.AAC.1